MQADWAIFLFLIDHLVDCHGGLIIDCRQITGKPVLAIDLKDLFLLKLKQTTLSEPRFFGNIYDSIGCCTGPPGNSQTGHLFFNKISVEFA